MRVFVTGASGWIGSAVVPELVSAGHAVTGLARSDASAERIRTAGATPVPGSLDDLESIRSGAAAADAVIHLGFKHDFSDYAGAGRTERAVVATIGDELAGSDRPFLFASGIVARPGELLTEDVASPYVGADAPRGGGEAFAFEYADRGVRPVALRFSPTVHGRGDHGFSTELVRVAREKGVAGYVGDGSNRWPAVHRLDAAHLVRLALGQATPAARVHGVSEEGIPTREIAEAIGAGLGLPVESIAPGDVDAHFGWIGRFFGMDIPASSAITRERYGWQPTHPTLLEDFASGYYFEAVAAR